MEHSKQKPGELSSEGVAAFSPEANGAARAQASASVAPISVPSPPSLPVSTWSPPDVVGDRFYGIRRLGWGGMGHVYHALDAELDRDVALKFTREPDDRARARFLREAETTAKLQHPNVVTVYDRGEVDGHLYIVMELVSGSSLYDIAKPMVWREVLKHGVALSSGLAAAHAKHILHRDIKPGNVMLTDNGEVKLIDFGLAKFAERSSTPNTSLAQERTVTETLRTRTSKGAEATEATPACRKTEPRQRLTDTGIMVGTAGYRAPECWCGEATPRSDVYSFGAVFFELCTGRAIYADVPPHALWAAVRDRDAPLVTELVPAVHPRLAEIIARCLSRDPSARYASGQELHEALRELHDRVSSRRDHVGGAESSEAIVIVKSMAWREIGSLIVSVFSAEGPTDDEWQTYMEDCQRKAAVGPMRVLVVTAGGVPTRQHRMDLREIVSTGPVPVAVVSDATTVHNINTELRWRNPGLKEFTHLDDALRYLGVDGPTEVDVRRHVNEMQHEVA